MYNWFKIFNKTEFLALGLTSKTYTIFLNGIGQKDILVTNGISIGILYEEVFLSLNLNDKNPFEFDNHAIFVDDDTQDVYLGVPIES